MSARIAVSDHGLLRYLERVMGLDTDALRKELASDHLSAQVQMLGDGKYPIGGRAQVVVKDYTIVTVLTRADQRP